jgi:hypothetical protein
VCWPYPTRLLSFNVGSAFAARLIGSQRCNGFSEKYQGAGRGAVALGALSSVLSFLVIACLLLSFTRCSPK